MERRDIDMTREELLAAGQVVEARLDEKPVTGSQNDQEGNNTPPGMAEALSAPGNVLVNDEAKIKIGRVDTTRQTLR